MQTGQFEKYVISAVAVALVVTALVVVWQQYNAYKEKRYAETITEVKNLYDAGSYEEAIRKAETAAKDSVLMSDTERLNLELRIANLYYNRGGPGDEERSIDSQKKIALDTTASGAVRSRAINNLASYYYEDRSPETFQKIFSGGLASLADENDKKTALRKLSELSYEIFQNIGALLRINYWYNGQLLDNTDNLTTQKKSEYIATIKKNLDEIDQIATRQNILVNWSKNSYASYLHRRAFSEASLSLAAKDSEFASKFQESYEGVIERYNEEQSRLGSTKITETIPYTYFYYAAFLNEIYDSKQKEKVETLTSNIVDVVNKKKDELGVRGFLTFIKEEWNRPASQKDHNYRFFLNLAKISPAFKQLLIDNGWNI